LSSEDGTVYAGAVYAGLGVEHQELKRDDVDHECEVRGDDHLNLMIFYDCEATGLSVYSDPITDIGAKVIASPIPLRHPTFFESGLNTQNHSYSR